MLAFLESYRKTKWQCTFSFIQQCFLQFTTSLDGNRLNINYVITAGVFFSLSLLTILSIMDFWDKKMKTEFMNLLTKCTRGIPNQDLFWLDFRDILIIMLMHIDLTRSSDDLMKHQHFHLITFIQFFCAKFHLSGSILWIQRLKH